MNIVLYWYTIEGITVPLPHQSIQDLYAALQESRLFGNPFQKFGFVQIGLIPPDIIFGLFVHQYPRIRVDYDDNKNESLIDEEDFERYVFILQPNAGRILLQRRRRRESRIPSWETVIERLRAVLQFLILQVDIPGAVQLTEGRVGHTRQEFLAAFRDPNSRVIYLEVADLDYRLLPREFRFFNPNHQFDEAFEYAMRPISEQTERISMQARQDGDLSVLPDTKGYVNMSRTPRLMRVVDKVTKRTSTYRDRVEQKREINVASEGMTAEEVLRAIETFSRTYESAHDRPANANRRARSGRPEQLSLLEELDTHESGYNPPRDRDR